MTIFPPQDRLVRKEVSLGVIREKLPPMDHIGLTIAPFKAVDSDDVIFGFAKGLTDGLTPARAEDAEAELAQKDLLFGGVGRASVTDWSQKDHYSASDVQRYQESQLLQLQLGANVQLPLAVGSAVTQLNDKIARDDAARRRRIDNRLEWLTMTALSTGGITYNDGKIKFIVDYQRPSNQSNQAPIALWTDAANMDPIQDFINVQNYMWINYYTHIDRAIISRKAIMSILNSTKFIARSGLAIPGTPTSGSSAATPIDPKYLIDGWGWQAAAAVVFRQTGITPIVYDSVYRTRPYGSGTITNNRFTPENQVIFLPPESDLTDIDDTGLGFGKMLTSPHPEGNFQSGYYEWEEKTVDPWGVNRGSGIKAFPVFPFMQYSFTMNVLA